MAIGTPTTLGSATGNSVSLTLPMTVTANVSVGDFIVVATGCFNSAASLAVADSAGNTYTASVAANSNRTGIFLCKAATGLTSGVSTITVTWGTSQTARMIAAFKVTGLAAASQLDQTATGTNGGTTTAWSAGTTATTTQADELIVAACSDDSAAAATSTPGAGYSEVHDITNGGAFQLTTIYKTVSSTGAQNPTGTWTSSAHTWNAAVATFKGDGAGGTDATVTAVPADATGTIPTPAASADATVVAPPADATGALPISGNELSSEVVTPPADATGDIPSPTVGSGAEVTAPPADGTGDIPAPTVQTGGNVDAPPADGTGDIPAPTVTGDVSATVTAPPLAATGDLPTPSQVGAPADPPPDTHPVTGGVYDQTPTGGTVTTFTRGGTTVVPRRGGTATTPKRGGTVTTPRRGGTPSLPLRGGVYDETSTGGEVL